jgi:hypothetical protein
MTTATEKIERQQWIDRRRANHHRALESLATNGQSGLQLWRKLRRIEKRAHSFATAYCNGDIDSAEWELFTEEFTQSVAEVFGQLPQGFFVNGDARGYALKLDNEKVTIPQGMDTDWGGYGILAAEIH